jgi:hypothetical protein
MPIPIDGLDLRMNSPSPRPARLNLDWRAQTPESSMPLGCHAPDCPRGIALPT